MRSQWGRGNLARFDSCQIAPSPLAQNAAYKGGTFGDGLVLFQK